VFAGQIDGAEKVVAPDWIWLIALVTASSMVLITLRSSVTVLVISILASAI